MNKNNILINLKNLPLASINSDEVNLAKDLVENKCKDENLFVCEGLWAIDKLIEKKIEVILFVFNQNVLENADFPQEDLNKIANMAKYAQKSVLVSEKACKKISDRDGYDEFFIIARAKKITLADLEKQFKNNNNCLGIIMDGLEQPGNIGAILRTCDAAGADFAISVNRRAKINNSRIVRASFGSSFMIPVLEEKMEDVVAFLEKNNFKVVLTDLQAKKSFKEADYSGKVVIVAGNEHTGITPSWRKVKNAESVIIPMLGSVESLNVGFATTLVAYEAGLKKFGNKK
ncbi:MAG: hypothetical protein J5689_03470 [Clostridia bacterium]|nr:hypothetical protein [Clostridia bacterium]